MIEQFTSGMDFEAFRSNPMAVSAVERKLQIISEAQRGLVTKRSGRFPVSRGVTSEESGTSFAMPVNELIGHNLECRD